MFAGESTSSGDSGGESASSADYEGDSAASLLILEGEGGVGSGRPVVSGGGSSFGGRPGGVGTGSGSGGGGTVGCGDRRSGSGCPEGAMNIHASSKLGLADAEAQPNSG